jgi:hypothetical protein
MAFLVNHALANLRLPVFSALEAIGVALVIGHCLVDTLCAGLNERTVLDNLDMMLEGCGVMKSAENLLVGSKAYQRPR